MHERLEDMISLFREADREVRLHLLLDFAERLPPLPAELIPERDIGLHRVPECQSPVYLRLDHTSGATRMYVDAPAEAPTVRGFVGVLRHVVDGAQTADVARLPMDLLSQLGVASLLGMMRTQGLNAILSRVRKSAEQALAEPA